MEFANNEPRDFIAEQLNGDPRDNVISKEQFEERVDKVFTTLWERLSKSFGPGGAGTFISIYPNYYNTKDGFTIMKNIAFNKKLDQFICDMCMDICSRLNFTVGDGTTSSVIATRSTYDSYREALRDENISKFIANMLPRDILAKFESLKEKILDKLAGMSESIKSDDPEVLAENIRKVVFISSNGNEEITDMISSLYKELKYPAISCVLSKDGAMHSSVVSGYKSTVSLTDKLYFNNDNNTCKLAGANIIIFSHKVTKDTYDYILKPLSDESRTRQKRLICIAPYYDEIAISGSISRELNHEYKATGSVNLILTTCKRPINGDKVALSDLAMLLNTSVITPDMESEIVEYVSTQAGLVHAPILDKLDIDGRNIEGVMIVTMDEEDSSKLYGEIYGKHNHSPRPANISGELIRVGYCDDVELGIETSVFSGFHYNEDLYKRHVAEANDELAEISRKVKTIGTFSADYNHKQQRVYALGLKTGVIEVGASSEISQNYLKDTVDDAVKAAKSAYENGVVLGCNVTLMRAMEMIHREVADDPVASTLLILLLNGFRSVYSTVLANVFDDFTITKDNGRQQINDYVQTIRNLRGIDDDAECVPEAIYEKAPITFFEDNTYNLYDALIDISIATNYVFDLSTCDFNKYVINSAETDKEILKATIDLLGLLITGNQVVIR